MNKFRIAIIVVIISIIGLIIVNKEKIKQIINKQALSTSNSSLTTTQSTATTIQPKPIDISKPIPESVRITDNIITKINQALQQPQPNQNIQQPVQQVTRIVEPSIPRISVQPTPVQPQPKPVTTITTTSTTTPSATEQKVLGLWQSKTGVTRVISVTPSTIQKMQSSGSNVVQATPGQVAKLVNTYQKLQELYKNPSYTVVRASSSNTTTSSSTSTTSRPSSSTTASSSTTTRPTSTTTSISTSRPTTTSTFRPSTPSTTSTFSSRVNSTLSSSRPISTSRTYSRPIYTSTSRFRM